MFVGQVQENECVVEADQEPFPAEVEFVISALEAGPRSAVERQKLKRVPYRVRAMFKLFSDPQEQPPCLLYTRHVNRQALGFISPRHLPLSHGGVLNIVGPDGTIMQVYCTVLRCREVAPGWHEGAVYFNREQQVFCAEQTPP
jgi:hypothetical protein